MAAPPPSMSVAPEPAGRALSKAALAVISFLGFFIIALIYLYIFRSSRMPNDWDKYWWAGLVGFIFALIFYLVHAGISEEPVTRILSGAFFALGAMFLYASIALNQGYQPNDRIMWLIVLSLIVIIVLVFVWRMSVQSAEDEVRRARRRRT